MGKLADHVQYRAMFTKVWSKKGLSLGTFGVKVITPGIT
jgi:hypothetical protein